jgi:hypothetical protein
MISFLLIPSSCEFHSPANRFHLCRFIDEAYDLDYLEAFFNEDDDELQRIEEAAADLGYGPLATCINVANFSSQRYHCRERPLHFSFLNQTLTSFPQLSTTEMN